MPTLTRTRRPAHVSPDADLAALAEVAWTLARLDAISVHEHAEAALALQERIQRGEAWIRTHNANDAWVAARDKVRNLRDRLDSELLAVHAYERVCITRCRETWGFIVNAGPDGFAIQLALWGGTISADDPPAALWRELLGDRALPDPPTVGGQWFVEPGKTGAAIWELPSLRKLLERKRGQAA